jgi:hypothetical protein
MEQLNWFIDPENERHICARCRGLPALKGPHPPTAKTPKTEVPVMFFKSKPKFEPKTQEAPTSDVATPTPVEVERNLAAPTPLELRRIRHLLDGRYDLEGQRYKESYTDAILALTLGVPEHWVLIERELAYGPAESPESETEAQVRMLNELIAQVHDHAEEANAAVARMDQLLKDFAVKSAS